MDLRFRLATSASTLETLLHGSVGLLSARSGGHLVSLHCYLSPYDLLEERTCAPLNLTDNNGKCTEDRNNVWMLNLFGFSQLRITQFNMS